MFRYRTLSRNGSIDPAGLTFCTIDVKTTGLSAAGGSSICELALVRHHIDGTILNEWGSLINPGKQVRATAYHGITTRMVRDAPSFADIAETVEAFASDAIIVAHNADHEESFLEAELERAGAQFSLGNVPVICTLVLARAQLSMPNYRLRTLYRAFFSDGLGPADYSALVNARATVRVLAELAAGKSAPLKLTGAATRSFPGSVASAYFYPRVETATVNKSTRGAWIPSLAERLPRFVDRPPFEGSDRDMYLHTVRDVLSSGPVTSESVQPIAEAMSRYRLSGLTAAAAHQDLFNSIATDHQAGRLPNSSPLQQIDRVAKELGVESGNAAPVILTRSENKVERVLTGYRIAVPGRDALSTEFANAARARGAAVVGSGVRKFTGLWGVVKAPGSSVDQPMLEAATAAGIPILHVEEAHRRLEEAIRSETERRRAMEVTFADPVVSWRGVELTASRYREMFVDPYPDRARKRSWRGLPGAAGSLTWSTNHAQARSRSRRSSGRSSSLQASDIVWTGKKIKKGCAVPVILTGFGLMAFTAALTAIVHWMT